MLTTLRVLRDGADLVGQFTFGGNGQTAPAGLVAFGRAGFGMDPRKPLVVYVRGEKGELMPIRAACDWLMDNGYEVECTFPPLARQLGLVA